MIIKGIVQDFTSFLFYHKQANLASCRTWLNDFVGLSCKLLLGTFSLRGTISRLFLQFVSFVVLSCVFCMILLFRIRTLVSFIIYLPVELSRSRYLNVFCAWHVALYIFTLRVDSAAVFASLSRTIILGFWYLVALAGHFVPSHVAYLADQIFPLPFRHLSIVAILSCYYWATDLGVQRVT